MESADAHRQAGGQKRPREIDRARKLVGLNADEPDQRLAAGLADHPDDLPGPDPPVGLIIGVQANLDVLAQHFAPLRVLGEAVQAGECIGRDGRPDPLDRIAVVVVVRRLDHHQMKQADAAAGRSVRGGPIRLRTPNFDHGGETSIFPTGMNPFPATTGLQS